MDMALERRLNVGKRGGLDGWAKRERERNWNNCNRINN